MTQYKVDEFGMWLGETVERNGVSVEPPVLLEGQKAFWRQGRWVVMDAIPQYVTDIIKDRKKQLVAARRYNEETKGVTANGVTIKTDRESQAQLAGATLASIIDPNYVCRWKMNEGFVDLDAATLASIATLVRTHVQNCFNREAELVAAVDDGTFTPSMLEEGW